MKNLLILLIVIFIVLVVFLFGNLKNTGKQNASIHSDEYMRYYNSVNQMGYEQLNKMHENLRPLVIKTLMGGIIAYYDDEIPDEKRKQVRQEIEGKHVIIPEKDRIYGCVTYDEADNLNSRVRNRLKFFEGE